MKAGDPITVVSAQASVAGISQMYVQDFVQAMNRADQFFYGPADSVYGIDELAHEGTHWIRGHHDIDTPEAKALLAAFALVR